MQPPQLQIDAPTVVRRNHVTSTGRADGPVMMFAHGFGCDQNMWRRLLPSFAGDHRIVLFDHVGAGRSDLTAYDPDKYASVDGYAQDLVEIVDELDLRDVVLVAHSISAMIAATAAVARPDRFARLVMVSPSPSFIDDRETGYVGGFSRDDIEELIDSLDTNYFGWARAMAPVVMGNPGAPELGDELTESFCRTDASIARDFARVTFLADHRDVLARVTTPTLVLQCSDDALAPVEVGRFTHQHLAGSSYVQLAAAGHCPHVSAPAETAAAIHAFLAES